jgi:hypothetical protein
LEHGTGTAAGTGYVVGYIQVRQPGKKSVFSEKLHFFRMLLQRFFQLDFLIVIIDADQE